VPDRESLLGARLWLAFATMLLVSGVGNTFPVFFPPLLAEFGGSRGATALTISLVWVLGAALGPVAGALVDRRDPRLVVGAGLAATAVGLLGAAFAPTLPIFIACFGVGAGIGVGLTGMVTQAAIIADTYSRRRGFATGIAFAGSMAGYVLAAPAQAAIVRIGWRGTLALHVALLLLLVPFIARLYPRRLTPRPTTAADRTLGAVARSGPFWALTIVFSVAPLVGYLATTQHALYFTAHGFRAGEAATMLMIGGVLSTAGRALAGLAADRFGAPAVGVVSYSMTLIGTLCLVGFEFHPAAWLAWGYVFFVFLPLGTRATIVAMLVPRLAPPSRFGAVFGALAIGNNLGAALGPFLSGAIYDVTRSYLAVYVVAVGLVASGLAALLSFLVFTDAGGPDIAPDAPQRSVAPRGTRDAAR
jgi:MFS family permease